MKSTFSQGIYGKFRAKGAGDGLNTLQIMKIMEGLHIFLMRINLRIAG